MTTFATFPILPSLQATLAERGLNTPTEIQLRAIPLLLKGRSVVGVAETGSGKTLAFALPLLHLLKQLENEGRKITEESQPRALVLVPTRDLGEQVARVMKLFTHATRLRVRSVLGGTTMEVAKKNVKGQFEVLVATPGRLLQMLERSQVFLNDVRFLAFDEADQMVDQGFLPAATKIVKACPPDRQLALFSATVSLEVQSLIGSLFAGAEVVRTQGSHRLVSGLTTKNLPVVSGKRFPMLENILQADVPGGTLLFTNTREQCDVVAALLKQANRPCVIYRGEMEKVERRANLQAFRSGKVNLLVSTDLASRGLDLEHVGRVINYHLPQQLENYLHRVGRTARAGRTGLVVNFVTERDQPLMAEMNSIRTK